MAVEPAAPGWYEDPSGEPGLFAFWDGTGWGARTRQPPERETLPMRAARPAGAHNRPVAVIVAIAVSVFGLAVLILLLNR